MRTFDMESCRDESVGEEALYSDSPSGKWLALYSILRQSGTARWRFCAFS